MDGYWKNFTLYKINSKRKLSVKFRLITCLALIWQLLTGILAEDLYEHVEKTNSLLS